ncbi:CCA tRNA nucleotidyltransferase [Breoghania sp. L-A4]|uniref:CCA tRNA nucleotidyltransferase n=1 Tax=Breoghania sp. L-A4 TaxID=2304600 RepID=UPI001967DF1A|nr:CCA tRNA nucleotidyltransferase [Breoghania sp. L-A4]
MAGSPIQPMRSLADADWLNTRAIRKVFAAIERDGDAARVVGGAVRNALLDEPVADIDIATTASPQDVTARARAAGLKAVPTGIEHGTVTVISSGTPFEVTTLREDVETFGRHASVRFGRDWTADAQRRDFTMNALYVDSTGAIFDPIGSGYADCLARHVRFIGEPEARIREDYLRILRFFRFHAQYGAGAMDAQGCPRSCNAATDCGICRPSVSVMKFAAFWSRRAPAAWWKRWPTPGSSRSRWAASCGSRISSI